MSCWKLRELPGFQTSACSNSSTVWHDTSLPQSRFLPWAPHARRCRDLGSACQQQCNRRDKNMWLPLSRSRSSRGSMPSSCHQHGKAMSQATRLVSAFMPSTAPAPVLLGYLATCILIRIRILRTMRIPNTRVPAELHQHLHDKIQHHCHRATTTFTSATSRTSSRRAAGKPCITLACYASSPPF